MKKLIAVVGMLVLAMVVAKAQDAAAVDPKHYKVTFDNDSVRILEVRLKPGEKTPMHSHPNHVVYALAASTITATSSDGKTDTMTSKTGEAHWRNAETHTVENTGKTESHALDIELKK
jgi:quercetin dioxygenase-like cupin family protein